MGVIKRNFFLHKFILFKNILWCDIAWRIQNIPKKKKQFPLDVLIRFDIVSMQTVELTIKNESSEKSDTLNNWQLLNKKRGQRVCVNYVHGKAPERFSYKDNALKNLYSLQKEEETIYDLMNVYVSLIKLNIFSFSMLYVQWITINLCLHIIAKR